MIPKTNGLITPETTVKFEDYPTKTYYIDPATNQISGFVGGLDAMRQAVEIIFSVERYKWRIYTPNFGIELEGLVGMDQGVAASELKRRIEEALIPDNRIYGASNFIFRWPDANTLHCSVTVNTVYGDFETGIEVAPYA